MYGGFWLCLAPDWIWIPHTALFLYDQISLDASKIGARDQYFGFPVRHSTQYTRPHFFLCDGQTYARYCFSFVYSG